MRRIVVGALGLVALLALTGTAAAGSLPGLPGAVAGATASAEDGDRPDTPDRLLEVRRFVECLRDSDADRAACADLKPRPAWTVPGHPRHHRGGN